LSLTALSVSPNPGSAGSTVTFTCTIVNTGTGESGEGVVRLLSQGQLVGRPQSLPRLAPGEEWNGSIHVRLSRTTPSGDYLVTGEVSAPNDGNGDNNRRTVKVTVR
jgi:uncharacterized membrane protein